nr:integrase, catalytic region, zinc finger, CCHC-type, peptidase aspartic, catalytic [Tanacetum cinerariifolium]
VKELNNIVFKRNQSAQTVHMLTKPQFFYDHSTRQALGFQNPCYLKRAQQLKPKLYDGSVIEKSDAIVIHDSEETLLLAEESRSKMIQKQNEPIMSEKKVNTKPVDYAALNQLSKDFETRFVPQVELSAEQAFWSRYLVQPEEPNLSTSTTIVEVPKELFKVRMRNNSFSEQSAPTFDQLFKINDLKAQSQENDTVIVKLKERLKSLSALKETLSILKGKAVVNEAVSLHSIDPELLKIDVAPLAPKLRNNMTAHTDYLRHTQEETATLREIVERVNLLSSASGSQPQGNTKNDRIQRAPNKLVVTLVYSRKSKAAKKKVPGSNLKIHKSVVVQIILWYLDSGCSKHMIGDRSQLINYVQKFLGTVKFGNDHVAKITGYDLEVAFCQHTCLIRNLDGVDLLTGSRGNNLYTLSLQDMMASSPICLLSKASKTKSWLSHRRLSHLNFGAINHLARQCLVREVGISHETSVARSPQQNGVVERRNRTLIKAARTMLIYAQALLFLWAEVVATAYFTQNRSIIRLRHGKTPYELLHNKLPDLSYLHVFGALCYLTNDSENLGKLQPKADIGLFIGYAPIKKAFRIYNRRERKPKKGQNRIKTGQKREAWRNREKFKAVAVGRARKTEQNAKRMAKKAKAVKSYSSLKRKKKRKGLKMQILQRTTTGAKSAHS